MTDQQPQGAAVPPSADGDVLRVEHISKKYGAVTALVDVNMHLRPGEVLGLIGDNGAGKSTLIKIICGFQPPTSGRIFLDGQEITFKSVDHARSLGIDVVYQDLALVNQLTVYENMFLNREPVRWPLLRKKQMRKEAQEHLDSMGIKTLKSVDLQVASLSGGQRQSIAVARSVFSNAKILLLDEPLAAMGVKEGAIILDLVRDLKEQGMSIIIIAHNYGQVFPVCRPGEPAARRPDHLRQVQPATPRSRSSPRWSWPSTARPSRSATAPRPDRYRWLTASARRAGHRILSGMMGDMSISHVAGRRAGGGQRGRTGWASAAALTVTALLGVGACSAGGTSSGQATPPATGNAQAGGAPQATGPVVPEHSTLHWHPCAGLLAQQGVPDCTMLSVPVDYAKPGGRHISLALDMIPATAPKSQQQGILLVNPGGPGGSGLPLAAEVAQGLSPGVAAQYDIVGFDPRGVGSSVPALSCDPELLRRRAAELHPGQSRRRAGAHQPGENLRHRLRQEVRLAAALYDVPGRGPRHGRHPRGVRRVENQLLRLLLWHLSRPGLRNPFPGPGPPDGAG